MDNPIANKVVVCLQSFQTLCSALLQPNLDFSEQIPLPKVKDELSRFKVWSGNIGAHRSGRSSLDYRLRDASHLRKRIIDLLEDLNESLGDGMLKYRFLSIGKEIFLTLLNARFKVLSPDTSYLFSNFCYSHLTARSYFNRPWRDNPLGRNITRWRYL